MSTTIGTFTTAHLESATGPHGQPLPLREKTYGACSGHCGCAMDWAALTAMAAERSASDALANRSIDVYHHQAVDFLGVEGSTSFAQAFGEYVEQSLANPTKQFLDPGWSPRDIDNNGWDLYHNLDANPPVGRIMHAFQRCSRPLKLNSDTNEPDTQQKPGPRDASRSPRSLDEMRRLFYDLKQMYRINTQCSIAYSGSQAITFERWPSGSETSSDPGTITLGADVLAVAQRVRNTQGYGVRNNGAAWAMVEMWCAKDNPQIYNAGNLKRTLCIPCTLGGALDTSRFNPSALKSWMLSAYGAFADGHDYYAQARIAGVYADIDFPADYFFAGWNWTPQGD